MITNVESPALPRMKRPTHCPVLIVEDDADLRDMMAQMLSLEGFETATAANGQEALEYLHATANPEVILLDLMMPVMDGWAFVEECHRKSFCTDVPIVVTSASHDLARTTNLHPIGLVTFLLFMHTGPRSSTVTTLMTGVPRRDVDASLLRARRQDMHFGLTCRGAGRPTQVGFSRGARARRLDRPRRAQDDQRHPGAPGRRLPP
jgi:CheY-like chemotaxis protein